jgi:hypothetical protein
MGDTQWKVTLNGEIPNSCCRDNKRLNNEFKKHNVKLVIQEGTGRLLRANQFTPCISSAGSAWCRNLLFPITGKPWTSASASN